MWRIFCLYRSTFALARTGRFELECIDCVDGTPGRPPSPNVPASRTTLFDRRYRDGQFDLIVGFHVLERVHHLGEFMAEIRRILAPHGRVYFVAPCVTHVAAACKGRDWKHFESPERFWYFSMFAMKQFMCAWGFEVCSAHRLSSRPHLAVVAERTDRIEL
jgi:SAM-dependent methyltransferase